MPRTTAEQVGGIIQVDSRIPLDPFIDTANSLVTEVCAPAGYSDIRLEMIERYLSAHFYTLRAPRAVSEQAGPVNVTYQSKVDLFLKTSHYGQTAILLDTAGGLAALCTEDAAGVGKQKIGVDWLGSRRTRIFPGRSLCLPEE